MHQLVYISTMRRPLATAELDGILDVSRRNNSRNGVTGLLLVGRNRFLQALEGPSASVLSTFDRIQRDERHFACVLISSRTVSERAFGDWSMASRSSTLGHDGSIEELVHELTEDLADPNLQAQLRGFAKLHSAA